ncbi:hypothetical protein [Streptomyces sp. NPDC059122]|uniref:hypothetical protein n=1 Tax=Streptomyces sp. NPDC059122 TaxID=3346732 RepID=UPI0036CE454A
MTPSTERATPPAPAAAAENLRTARRRADAEAAARDARETRCEEETWDAEGGAAAPEAPVVHGPPVRGPARRPKDVRT